MPAEQRNSKRRESNSAYSIFEIGVGQTAIVENPVKHMQGFYDKTNCSGRIQVGLLTLVLRTQAKEEIDENVSLD